MILDELHAADPGERQARLVRFIEGQLLEILQWPTGRRSELSRGFMEIGLDSLMSIDLQYRMQTALGFAAASPDDFRQPSVEALAAHLLEGCLSLDPVLQ